MQQCDRLSFNLGKLQNAADILKVMGHPVRIQIIDLLKNGEKSVGEICSDLHLAQPYVSQQLNLMKSKGIIQARRQGNQVFYAIANFKVVEVIDCICDCIEKHL
ncbi:MAG: metalloregulator ArsR/SmtB family transcription factor [Candidatus Desulfofervidaceae bacterium]|nr:metalloregulator ArsR/SmtB family transcription factor [Candidatus Desulfofervidaceae bacterium]